MEKLFYSIGEVAGILGESVSLVRFWSNSFPKFIKPQRNAKGNRLYHPEDIDTLKQIQFLLKKQGLTLEGTRQRMTEDRLLPPAGENTDAPVRRQSAPDGKPWPADCDTAPL